MTRIEVTDRMGRVQVIEGQPGYTIMEILRDHGFDVAATCGGMASCATCHVYLDERSYTEVPDAEDGEQELIQELEFYRPGASRLSCQITAEDDLDGLRLALAPEE